MKRVLFAIAISATLVSGQLIGLVPPCRDPGIAGPMTQPGLRRPEIMSKIDPQYTEEARRQQIKGTVTVCLVIETDGRASHMSVSSGLGAGLDAAALDAVRQWRFIPAIKDNGDAVSVWVEVTVDFSDPDPPLQNVSPIVTQVRASSAADQRPPSAQPVTAAQIPPADPHPSNGKKRVFVGESNTFYNSSFSTSSASLVATNSYAKGNARGFGFSSAGMQRFAINIMKAIHDNCPNLDVTDDLDTADFFLRMDRDAVFGPAKMAIFDRTRTMVFVASTHSISKDVKRFKGCR